VKLLPTPIGGLLVAEGTAATDERGSFLRTWCATTFAGAGAGAAVVQTSLATNPRALTLRGLHLQHLPSREGKLVRCLRGRIFDVAVDLRAGSPTFRQHYAMELSRANARALFIPPGLAHGYLTLADDCDVLYHMTDAHAPDLAGGYRWDDPAFAIPWPATPALIGTRDAGYAALPPGFAGLTGY
jgi:dTDP-4-dehydrorhamnose 3,5-epimerase